MKERLLIELNKIKKEFSETIKKQGEQKVVAYLYIIFSLAAITVFGMFAIRPTLSTISQLHKEKSDSEFALEKLIEKNQALQRLNGEYQTLGSKIESVYDAIPTTSDIPELTRKIEIIANKNNLILNTLSAGTIELYPANRSNNSLFSYTMTVSILGSESDINSFIKEFINMDRIIALDRVTTGKSEQNLFSATIVGRAFFIK